ncbi:MAG: phosphatase PAP2 family protein [Acutalibacteraceae bacterium]|nr:phosphatase PAP2 family protein [Acutalibacteraceae bacterium]
MTKENKKQLCKSIFMFVAFSLWTALISFADVRAIGPNESTVGLATVNGFIRNFTGVNMCLYTVTDWLGLVPLAVVVGFAAVGLMQWIWRKDIKKVDYDILVLGGFYVITMSVYILFENVVINYRPVLINGILEASYPSSTTLLALCVMPTAIMQFKVRIKNSILKKSVIALFYLFTVFMVICRLISGVHWLTDIVGGILLSTALVMLYRFAVNLKDNRKI